MIAETSSVGNPTCAGRIAMITTGTPGRGFALIVDLSVKERLCRGIWRPACRVRESFEKQVCTGYQLAIAALLSLVGLWTTGCASVGPDSIASDRFDYNEAISQSWKKQILTNMIRLRYGEPVVFLEVSSVISQYSLEGEVSVGGGINAIEGQDRTLSMGGIGRWADRPTITYTPKSGQAFTSELLTPMLPEAVFSLVQAGWHPDLVLGLSLRSLNGLRVRESDNLQFNPDFHAVIDALMILDEAGAVGVRRDMAGDRGDTYLYLRSTSDDPTINAAVAVVREKLKLAPQVKEFKLVYGRLPDSDTEIAVLSLSVLEILRSFSSLFQVPPLHVEQGRTPTSALRVAANTVHQAPIDVRFSEKQPVDAFVAVRNRDFWFYIDDRDYDSKNTFSMLMVLISLAESGSARVGPLVTIGAGGR